MLWLLMKTNKNVSVYYIYGIISCNKTSYYIDMKRLKYDTNYGNMFSVSLHRQGDRFRDFSSRSVKTWDCPRFSPAREFSQTLLRISAGHEGMGNRFYLFYKIIIFLQRRHMNRVCMIIFLSWNCKFSQLRDRQLYRSHHICACFIALWKHTYWPIKTHVLSKLFYK